MSMYGEVRYDQMESKVKFVMRTEGRKARLAAALQRISEFSADDQVLEVRLPFDVPGNEDCVTEDAMNVVLLQPRYLLAD